MSRLKPRPDTNPTVRRKLRRFKPVQGL